MKNSPTSKEEDAERIKLLHRAWVERETFGTICVDTLIALSNLGIDPEIVKEEASRHGGQ